MLDRILRHGVRSSSSTIGMCWRCLLERQHLQHSIHNTPSRRSRSSANNPSAESKADGKAVAAPAPATAGKPEKSKDAATKPGEKTKRAKTDDKSIERTDKKSKRRRGEGKIRNIAGLAKSRSVLTPKVKAKGVPERGDVAKDMLGWGERSGRVRSPAADGGRLRMRRHMASLKKDPTFAELDSREDSAGATIEEAMSGTSMEGGDKKGGEVSAGFMTKDLEIKVVNKELGPVPRLAHGLQRALFNHGVLQFRDLHSRVYNFDPALEMLPPADKVDFDSLSQFTPPSRDKVLAQIAHETGKRYIGSTSSLTGLLKHFHFLLSNFRPLNFNMLSHLNESPWKFTKITKCPDAIMLRYREGIYSCDADKEFDGPNVLSLMGRYLEKYLTSGKETFEKYKVGNKHLITEEDAELEAFHYSTVDDFLMRSQLDAYDPRLPGTGIFDLKTRAVLPIRMDTQDFEWGMDYEINQREGKELSFEREFADMARATMLKYSLQVRIGRMDGIFVAYHNIARIFGFQYISLNEMDFTLHGQEDRCLGDQEFVASMHLLNELVNRATEKFPKKSLRIHVETPDTTKEHALYFFAEPVTDAQIDEIQNGSKAKTAQWEAELLGLNEVPDQAAVQSTDPDPHSSFITLASDTDRFRARIRKIQDGRINPISEAGGVTSKSKRPPSSSEPQEQHDAKSEAAPATTDATLVALDSEHGMDETETLTIQQHEPTLENIMNDVADITELSAIAIDANVNIEMETHTTVDHTNLDDILKTDNLGEHVVNNVLSESKREATTDPTTDLAIDFLVETVGETSASPTDTNTYYLEPSQTVNQSRGQEQEPVEKGKAKPDAQSKAQALHQKANAEEEESKRQGPLIALVLKTRSTVNNVVCGAPKNLKLSDKWKIAHSITEVSTPRRAWMLYEGTKRRRRALMHDKKVERAKSSEKDWFRDNLKKVTLDARDWREEQERKDRKKEDEDKGVWVWDREKPVKRGEYVSRYG